MSRSKKARPERQNNPSSRHPRRSKGARKGPILGALLASLVIAFSYAGLRHFGVGRDIDLRGFWAQTPESAAEPVAEIATAGLQSDFCLEMSGTTDPRKCWLAKGLAGHRDSPGGDVDMAAETPGEASGLTLAAGLPVADGQTANDDSQPETTADDDATPTDGDDSNGDASGLANELNQIDPAGNGGYASNLSGNPSGHLSGMPATSFVSGSGLAGNSRNGGRGGRGSRVYAGGSNFGYGLGYGGGLSGTTGDGTGNGSGTDSGNGGDSGSSSTTATDGMFPVTVIASESGPGGGSGSGDNGSGGGSGSGSGSGSGGGNGSGGGSGSGSGSGSGGGNGSGGNGSGGGSGSGGNGSGSGGNASGSGDNGTGSGSGSGNGSGGGSGSGGNSGTTGDTGNGNGSGGNGNGSGDGDNGPGNGGSFTLLSLPVNGGGGMGGDGGYVDDGGPGDGYHEVPEPGTLALFGFGLAGLGAIRRRRRARG